jgi:hypothetical protein
MSWYEFRPYVPVAQRQRQAQQELKKLKKKGQTVAPVTIEGRTIAKSFWGKSWCDNLERYSDYESRLPRGRTYVRNGSVVDLQIAKGEIVAFVAGSELYKIKIGIAPVKPSRWKSICRDCAGSIDSLVELLQGRLAKGGEDISLSKAPSAANVLDDSDVAALFGLEMADTGGSKAAESPKHVGKVSKRAKGTKGTKAAEKTKTKAKSATASSRAMSGKEGTRVNAPARRQPSRATKRGHPVI